MALELASPATVNHEVHSIRIESVALDLKLPAIYIGYDELDSEGNIIRDDVVAAFETTEAQELIGANADIYAAMKAALYAALIERKGMTGTVL